MKDSIAENIAMSSAPDTAMYRDERHTVLIHWKSLESGKTSYISLRFGTWEDAQRMFWMSRLLEALKLHMAWALLMGQIGEHISSGRSNRESQKWGTDDGERFLYFRNDMKTALVAAIGEPLVDQRLLPNVMYDMLLPSHASISDTIDRSISYAFEHEMEGMP